MTQFHIDYKKGKSSEANSLNDLSKIFKTNLVLNDDDFAHFDYFSNDNICVELKTRQNIEFKDNEFFYTTRNGRKMILDTLIFDAVKMRYAFQYNKKNKIKKDFYVVWKTKDKYFYWKLNWDRQDYYIHENLSGDFGHGHKQTRDVINVYTSALTTAP